MKIRFTIIIYTIINGGVCVNIYVYVSKSIYYFLKIRNVIQKADSIKTPLGQPMNRTNGTLNIDPVSICPLELSGTK